MDTTSLIIGLGFLAICVLPFIYVRIATRKKEQKFQANYLQKAQEFGLQLSEYETWSLCYAIGMDADKTHLLYFNVENNNWMNVDLTSFSSASIIRKDKKTIENDTVIDALFLDIDCNGRKTTLEFYNSHISYGLNDELKIIEKWWKLLAR